MPQPQSPHKIAQILFAQGPKTFTITYDCYHRPGIHTAQIIAANEEHAIDTFRRSNTARNVISIASIYTPTMQLPINT